MDAKTLINAIRTHDDLSSIASAMGVNMADLKSHLISLIGPIEEEITPAETPAEDSSDDEYTSDNEESLYDRIIRKAPIRFTDEQKEFMRLVVKERKSVSLLCPAGYGKSASINTTIQLLRATLVPYTDAQMRSQYGRNVDLKGAAYMSPIGLCASTGKAASLIGGRTINSFLGIGIARGDVDDWVKRTMTMKWMKPTLIALRMTQVLIIDEISMISAQLMNKISLYLQTLRKNDAPFGGIQMICVGDVCQLPPVVGTFFFKSSEYLELNPTKIQFTKCFRQDDPVFVNALTEIRYGGCSDDTYELFKAQTTIDEEFANSMQPTRLLSTNAEVDVINERELLKACDGDLSKITTYKVRRSPGYPEKKVDAIRKADNIPDEVKLTMGAQAMVIYNLGNGLVNGTQGKVVDLSPNEVKLELVSGVVVAIPFHAYKDPDDGDIYTARTMFSYMPLRLCYAMSIHKSQGASMQLVEIDMKRIFAHGQAYVALSRCTDLRGLIVKNFSRKAIICDKLVLTYYGM